MNPKNLLDTIQSLYNCPTNKYRATPLLRTLSYKDRKLMALSKNTRPEILAILAADENDSYIRCYVAQNTSTPATILEILAKDKFPYVKSYVAQNTSTPVKILEILAVDSDNIVRAKAIKNLKEIK